MSDEQPIAIVGITGNQAGATAKHLLENGAQVRGIARDPSKAVAWANSNAELVTGSMEDYKSLVQAFQGCRSVYFATPMMIVDGEIQMGKNVVDAAKEAGVSHLKLVWIETPTNPTLRLVDIAAAAKIAHEHNALLVVDNTFMTPYFQSPLELGADIVSYSVTKYLNGHSDVLMGVALTNSKSYHDELTQAQGVLGGVPSPFDLFLARRGLMTLEVRMQRHETNANALAKYLETRLVDAVEQVIYTGLPSHPQHELAKRQQRGFGAVISIRLKKKQDGDPVQVFINNLQIAENATSLGGTETTVSVPHQTGSHAMLPEDLCRSLGVDGYLVRISVGIETLDDLIDDFGQALDKAYA